MQHNFKIGDEVERINSMHGKYKPGDKGKVTGFLGTQLSLENGGHYHYAPCNFKLVKSAELNYEIY